MGSNPTLSAVDKKTIDQIRIIILEENDFGEYNHLILDHCFPNDETVTLVTDGIEQTWRRLPSSNKFALQDNLVTIENYV